MPNPARNALYTKVYKDKEVCCAYSGEVCRVPLSNSTEPFYSGVGLFQMALEKWLPCFGNHTYEGMTFQIPAAIGR